MGAGDGNPTITDVARLAGVSMKSVSRVINKEPNVSDELRARVTDAAAALGYRPNFSARSLAGVRSYLMGYLFGDPGGDYTHNVEVNLLNRCRAAGYHLLIEQLDADTGDIAERTAALVSQLRLDGVVLTPPMTDNQDVLGVLESARVPYVRIAPNLDSDRSPQVCMDDFGAARELTQYLLGLGHRNIAIIKGDPGHVAARLRFEGFVDAMAAQGLVVPERNIEQGNFSYGSGLQCARRLLDRARPPSAIFASNDDMAAAVVAVAHSKGIDIPGELSVVGFDDAPVAQIVWPTLTTVRQPIDRMADAAAQLLLGRLAIRGGGQWPAPMPRVELAYELKLRESSAPLPRKLARRTG